MASTISDTDMQVFANLANPQKANVNRLTSADREEPQLLDTAREEDSESDDASEEENNNSDDSRSEHDNQSRVSQLDQRSKVSQKSHMSHASKVSSHKSNNSDSSASDSEKSSVVSNKSKRSEIRSAVSHKSGMTNRSERHAASHVSAFDAYVSSSKPMELPQLNTSQMQEMEILEKQQVLMDMERLKMQGVTLSKNWTLNDRLDDMQFEIKRHMLHIDEMNNINMMRDGMRLMCSGFEMMNARLGLLELDGWAAEVTKDMGKYDNALGRIYRKYWRKTTQSSPEMEIAMGVIGSMGMFHFKQKMQNKMFKKPTHVPPPREPKMPSYRPPKQPQSKEESDSDSDDEDLPP